MRCASMAARSIGSWFEQALVARRQTHFSYDAETTARFLAHRRAAVRRAHRLLLALQFPLPDGHRPFGRQARTADHESEASSWPNGKLRFRRPVSIPNNGKVRLTLEIRGPALQFFYAFAARAPDRRSARCSTPRSFPTNAAVTPSTAASPAPSSASPPPTSMAQRCRQTSPISCIVRCITSQRSLLKMNWLLLTGGHRIKGPRRRAGGYRRA